MDDVGKLLLRVSLGVLILMHGLHKLIHGITGVEALVVRAGLPHWLAYGVYVGEVLAPLLVILGFYGRLGAVLIAVTMVFAIGLAHADEIAALTRTGGWAIELQWMFFIAAVTVALSGPGRYAINTRAESLSRRSAGGRTGPAQCSAADQVIAHRPRARQVDRVAPMRRRCAMSRRSEWPAQTVVIVALLSAVFLAQATVVSPVRAGDAPAGFAAQGLAVAPGGEAAAAATRHANRADRGASAGPSPEASGPWLFGLLPFESPLALHRRFAGLAEDWTALGIGEVRLESSPDFATHTARLLDQRYDFVYTAPHFVAHHLRRGTYEALAVLDEPLRVGWVERDDAAAPDQAAGAPSGDGRGHDADPSEGSAPARATADLEDWAWSLCQAHAGDPGDPGSGRPERTLRVALPPSEAVIHVVGRAQIEALLPTVFERCDGAAVRVEWLEMPSHNAALAAVLAGRADLAGASIFVIARALRERQPLRLVGRSAPFPSGAILAHTRVPASVRESVRTRMVTLHEDPNARALRETLAYPPWRLADPDEFETFYQLVPWLEFWDGTLQDWRQRLLRPSMARRGSQDHDLNRVGVAGGARILVDARERPAGGVDTRADLWRRTPPDGLCDDRDGGVWPDARGAAGRPLPTSARLWAQHGPVRDGVTP